MASLGSTLITPECPNTDDGSTRTQAGASEIKANPKEASTKASEPLGGYLDLLMNTLSQLRTT